MHPTILVVESRKNHRLLWLQELEDEGYRALAMDDLAAAVKTLKCLRPNLVVTDVEGMGRSWMEPILQLQATRNSTPVILHTAHADLRSLFESLADAIVVKSSNPIPLLHAIRQVLRGKAWLPNSHRLADAMSLAWAGSLTFLSPKCNPTVTHATL